MVADGSAGRGKTEGGPTECASGPRSEEHTSELQSQSNLVCRLPLDKKRPSSTRHWAPARRFRSASPPYGRMSSSCRCSCLKDQKRDFHSTARLAPGRHLLPPPRLR